MIRYYYTPGAGPLRVVVVAEANSVLHALAHGRLQRGESVLCLEGTRQAIAYLGARVGVAAESITNLLGVGLLALQVACE